MNSIELKNTCDIDIFLRYLGKHLNTQGLPTDIKNYTIHIDTDNKSILSPWLGDFHWKHDDEIYLITFKEEGNPLADSMHPTYFKRLTIQHPDLTLLKEFVTHALTYTKDIDKQKVKLWCSKSRGFWESYDEVYVQTLEKVYIDNTVKSMIINLIDSFISSRTKYITHGRSHKLNFLFTGVAGSGKTSLVKALALHYKRPIYILSFCKKITDESIVDLVSDIKDNSILLLEDIDSFFVDRKAMDINISFSCLINVLDGTLCKGNGIITVLTANNPERLDPALIRPGRIDKIIKFDYPKKTDVEKAFMDLVDPALATKDMFDAFYNKVKKVRINMSALVGYLFKYPTGFMESIVELLDDVHVLQEIVNDKSDKMYS
jgi:hypothetical protein